MILKKLYGGIKIWCVQHRTLAIDTLMLTKCKRLLLAMTSLLTLMPIKKMITNRPSITFVYRQKFTKPNINVLVEKWMSCDSIWTSNFTRFDYVTRLKGNEDYCFEDVISKEFWSLLSILDLYEKL